MSSAGGSSLSTCVTGLASAAVSRQSTGAQPRYLPGAELADCSAGPEIGALRKSKIPYQVTNPCTQSDCTARGDCGSGLPCLRNTGASDSTLQEVAARAASCPPAEPPQRITRVGSMPNCELFERSQRMEVFTSWIAAGNRASPLSRYSIDATT